MSYPEISEKLRLLAEKIDEKTSGTGKDYFLKFEARDALKNAFKCVGFKDVYQDLAEHLTDKFEPVPIQKLKRAAIAFGQGNQAIKDEFEEELDLFVLQHR